MYPLLSCHLVHGPVINIWLVIVRKDNKAWEERRVGFDLETKSTHFRVNDEDHWRGTLRSLGKGAVTH